MTRGLDETNDRYMFRDFDTGIPLFKGKDVHPFSLGSPALWVEPKLYDPRSTDSFCDRIGWRDVARPNLKRRLFAAIIPKGSAMGNSLNYLVADDQDANYFIMGLLNSLILDYRVRLTTSNSHINQYVVAQLPVPRLSNGASFRAIVGLSRNLSRLKPSLSTLAMDECKLNAEVATLYGLTISELNLILRCYPWLTEKEVESIHQHFHAPIE